MINLCLCCQAPITKGRSDKKFCSSGCKDNFYNAIKSEEQKEIGRIDTILKRNRRILKKLFNPRKEETFVHRETLIREGFEFEFHTHHYATKYQSYEYLFCYDYGYRLAGGHLYKVIKSFK
ncbi:hypothetical protein [Niabella ginsengisoli]|uniref:DUF2116 family Zn-ribbon domain-containing protein n=1 Tax=Niabella ginsengisoli TaxID=522298 RepID=A0ABS9SI01_9BACT|nr:hypothetical protein [Niabella ginsengisoli]MCH5597987.1 hypothetical protein [Niabella ginsengisoli]